MSFYEQERQFMIGVAAGCVATLIAVGGIVGKLLVYSVL